MGGLGSGNHYHWWRGNKKTAVEHCLNLDANRWMRDGILAAGTCRVGSCRWTYPGGSCFLVNYQADTLDADYPFVRLWYTWVWTSTKQQESADYRVQLTTTRPRFGGLRWWFVCPLGMNGRACERRVAKLYLPPAERYFGCRHCHRLTYTSCQEHDKRVDALRRNPEALAALVNNLEGASIQQLCLALKAIR
jgi:hypothetical protein